MEKTTGNDILGVVMCGGQSSRMGTDKGLLIKDGLHWAKITKNTLDSLLERTSISINKDQLQSYSKIFSFCELIVDSANLKGPLRGLLTVHDSFPDYSLLLLACDMVFMSIDTIKKLIEEYKSNHKYDFYVFRKDNRPEPLCALYTSKGIQSTYEKLIRMDLDSNKSMSLNHFISLGLTKYINLDPSHEKDLANINTQQDRIALTNNRF